MGDLLFIVERMSQKECKACYVAGADIPYMREVLDTGQSKRGYESFKVNGKDEMCEVIIPIILYQCDRCKRIDVD